MYLLSFMRILIFPCQLSRLGLTVESIFAFSAMGKSRSATCCVAYLMQTYKISPQEALEQIRQVRPIVEPNDGFMQQLDMYHRMNMVEDVESSPIYQRWIYHRAVQVSADCGQAPEVDNIRFEDEHVETEVSASDSPDAEYKCKKCRLVHQYVRNFPFVNSGLSRFLMHMNLLTHVGRSVAHSRLRHS
jgi:hypothetical protein